MKILRKALCYSIICYTCYMPTLHMDNTTYLKTYNSNITSVSITDTKLENMARNSDKITEIDCSNDATTNLADDYSKVHNASETSLGKETIKEILDEVKPKPIVKTASTTTKEITVEDVRKTEEQRDAKKIATQATQTVACKVRDYELNELYRIVEAESGNQAMQGRELVAKVVLNRVKSQTFPNNIHDVIFQKNQFSPILDGRYWSITPSDTTITAVNNVLQGSSTIDSQGALFFMEEEAASASGAAYIRTRQFLFKYGCHSFWK